MNCRRSVSSRFLAAWIILLCRVRRSCSICRASTRRAFERGIDGRPTAATSAASSPRRHCCASWNAPRRAGGNCASSSRFSALSSCACRRDPAAASYFAQEPRGRRVEHRGASRAARTSGIGMPKCRVHAAQLAEVRQFARPADVGDRREQRVLDQRAQQHVRAEAAGRRQRLARSAPPARRARRRREGAVGDAHGVPPVARGRTGRRRRRAWSTCAWKPSCCEARRRPRPRGAAVRPGCCSSCAKTSATSGFARRVGTVVDDQAHRARATASSQRPKASDIARPSAVGRGAACRATSAVNSVGGSASPQRRRPSPRSGRRARSCATGTSPAPAGAGSVIDRAALNSASSTVVDGDLVPVVVFAVDPEDGDGRHAVVAPRRSRATSMAVSAFSSV